MKRAAFYAVSALLGLVLAAACAPKEIAPPIQPEVYALEFSDGVRCIAIDTGGDDVDLICDFSRVQAEVATEVLL